VRLSLVFHVFLARMALGTLASLLVVARTRAAERHVRFLLLLAALLAGGAAALHGPAFAGPDVRPEWPRGLEAFVSPEGSIPGALVAAAALAMAGNVLFGLYRRTAARAALVASVVAAAVATFGTARIAIPDSAAWVAARTSAGILGGVLMGGVNGAMVLGHFYLMIRGLPLEALARTAVFCVAAILARAAAFGLLLLAWPGAFDGLFGRDVIWSSWRAAFGFVGPLVLVWMTRDALRYRHTQAATGILYVAVFFALMGELAATYLELRTGYPV
jgi:hypothetical protein